MAANGLVLASASPRREQLLRQLGVRFTVLAPEVDETPRPGEAPEMLAQRLARAKAAAVAARCPGALVLAADTVVALDGWLLGKPADAAEATAMLRALRAAPHDVYTGVCVREPDGSEHVAVERTRVWMRAYSDAEIARSVASGELFDKAGAYAIQDPVLQPVARLVGCYTNVVGLPLCQAARLLAAAGVPVAPPNGWRCEHRADEPPPP
ncbi:MAG TPA: Maf family protein [Chloroflexota bacterium]|nr:Maf family protein [Chloroflexota bacterium]